MRLLFLNSLVAVKLHGFTNQLSSFAIGLPGEFLEFAVDRLGYMYRDGLHMYQYMAEKGSWQTPNYPSPGRFVCQSVAL